jgi:hypothetical protein
MRTRSLAAAVAALLVPAAPAFAAGDPIMPLAEVHAGMQCAGYSVVRGTDISAFGVDVVDVVDGDPDETGPRILVQVSGAAVDATGIGPGFSGSPIYCDGRAIGAISESIGEYGGKTVLATPMEQIVGTPVDAPSKPAAQTTRAADAGHASTARAAWERDLLASAKPLAAPLTISGLSPSIASALAATGQKLGRPVLAAPAGPLGSFPKQTLRPGAAVGTAYSSGDLRFGAVGTVSYVDGDKVWAFGHPLEDAGARALLLQDAYVFRVVNNPVSLGTATTYKLASLGHDLGTLSNDSSNAVVGRTGPLPHTVPVTVHARDLVTGAQQDVNTSVADEEAVDLPSGGSWLTSVGPLAVVQASTSVLGATPGRVTGRMCVRIRISELKQPMRFCNRYVSIAQEQADDGSLGNAVTTNAASDLAGALSSIDAYSGKPPHILGVEVLLELRRSADQAFLRHISVPAHVRPGQTISVKTTLQRLRGAQFKRTYKLRIPGDAKHGELKLRLTGRDADSGDSGLGTTIIIGDDTEDDGAGDAGPGSIRELADEVESTERYDGVTFRLGSARGRAFRDDDVRISGRAEATVHVQKR